MDEVSTRDIPGRSLLCVKRSVRGQAQAWAFGKQFVATLRQHALPRLDGGAGAVFCIYWGEVSDDSDGPLEWCRPVPDEQAPALAAQIPELGLRTEPAHREAFVDLGPGGTTTPAQWRLISESLHGWAVEHAARPNALGVRITYLARVPVTESSVPDCDFAVPIG